MGQNADGTPLDVCFNKVFEALRTQEDLYQLNWEFATKRLNPFWIIGYRKERETKT